MFQCAGLMLLWILIEGPIPLAEIIPWEINYTNRTVLKMILSLTRTF